ALLPARMFTVADEVIPPRHETPGRVHAGLEEVEPSWPIVVVAHVVFARPQHLHGHANLLRDGSGLAHVVVGQTAAESATGALDVDRDVRFGNTKRARHERAPVGWRLRRRPDLHLAVAPVRRAVLRLERCGRDKEIVVRRLDNLGRTLQGLISIAVDTQREAGLPGGNLARAARKPLAALLRGRTFVPLHLKLFARGLGLP